MTFAYIYKVGLFGSFCTGIFLTSCMERGNGEASKRVIEVDKVISSPARLKASDYLDEIRYVPSETRGGCLVGNSPDIKLPSRCTLTTSANRQCLLFDKVTGKFKCQIGHVREDPGGYRNVDYLVNELNRHLLFNGWGHDLISYNLDGNYIGRIELLISLRKYSCGQ